MQDYLFEYTRPLANYGELMTVESFIFKCKYGYLSDYDGHAVPVLDRRMSDREIRPSQFKQIPDTATHVMWFNK